MRISSNLQLSVIKDNTENLLKEEKAIADRLTEYCTDLYNVGLATDFKTLSKDQVSEKEPEDPIYISAGVWEKVAEAFF